jgi:hypothetical protein
MKRLLLVCVLGLACWLAADAWSAPAGATTRCRDGTYSYSQRRSGTCSHHGGVAAWLTRSGSPGSSGSSPAPATSLGHTVLLAKRTRTAGCRRSLEPDRSCSPGAYYSGLTMAVICSPTFRTGAIRDVTDAEKFAVERAYGMRARGYGQTIEIDHIVPLELGGSNSIANLFPEPGSGADSYRVKDRLENQARDAVCVGQIGLQTARAAIASDWEGLYRRLFGTAPVG